jgi:hypothetical protein
MPVVNIGGIIPLVTNGGAAARASAEHNMKASTLSSQSSMISKSIRMESARTGSVSILPTMTIPRIIRMYASGEIVPTMNVISTSTARATRETVLKNIVPAYVQTRITLRRFQRFKTVRFNAQGTASMEAYRVDRDTVKEITDYMPRYYSQSAQVQAMTGTVSNESTRLQAITEDILNQLYVETATWGLSRWESLFKIPTVTTDSFDVRRERVKERIATHGTLTYARLSELSSRFIESNVVEDSKNYQVVVRTNRRYYPDNAYLAPVPDDMIAFIRSFAPAHMGVDFKVGRTDWAEIMYVKANWKDNTNLSMNWNQMMTDRYYAGIGMWYYMEFYQTTFAQLEAGYTWDMLVPNIQREWV